MNLIKQKPKRISPFQLFEDWDKDFDSFFGGPLLGFRNDWKNLPNFAVEVQEESDSYVVEADLPGVAKKDIEVELDGDVLRIKAERKQEIKEKNYSEKSYGTFERSIRLGENIKLEQVNADFKDGVLKVRLPKAELTKEESVSININ